MLSLSTSRVRPASCRADRQLRIATVPPCRTFVKQSLNRRVDRGVVCQGLFGLGLPELAVIAGVAALIFGPSKLPELGKSLGRTVKSFQGAAKEFESELKAAAASDDEAPKPPTPTEQDKTKPN